MDIGAQGLGIALGVKAAAIGVVALGAYPFAVVALPAAAIVGAFGLQHIVNRSRSEELGALLEDFETTRTAAEQSARILVDIARDDVAAYIAKTRASRERNIADLRREWGDALAEAEEASQREFTLCAQAVITLIDAQRQEAVGRRFAEAMAEPDGPYRLSALDAAIEAELAGLPPASTPAVTRCGLILTLRASATANAA